MSDLSRRLKTTTVYQSFSLPEALVFYIAKNPLSREVYQKLIRCCKYFSLKSCIITFTRLERYCNEKYWATYKINGFRKYRQKFNIEDVNKKLWIHFNLTVGNQQNQFLASALMLKIYRCDLIRFNLAFQSLTFNEFQKCTSSGCLESLYLYKTTVKNDDGTMVPIEKLIELLPKLQKIDSQNVPGEEGQQTITSETAANLVAIPHFPKIKHFSLTEIPETFDIKTFFATPKVRTFFD